MNRIIIDGNIIDSRDAFFNTVRSQVGADKLVGSNLDALHDVLTSITVHTVIEVQNRRLLEAALGDFWKRIMWVLTDCIDENRDLKLELME